ncbi:hypothetical protein JW766_02410 [Candidatus Dojkabacteria bacterium]|nr:hypothetical protein [Candidatus Dojkabacteria bacterium]
MPWHLYSPDGITPAPQYMDKGESEPSLGRQAAIAMAILILAASCALCGRREQRDIQSPMTTPVAERPTLPQIVEP